MDLENTDPRRQQLEKKNEKRREKRKQETSSERVDRLMKRNNSDILEQNRLRDRTRKALRRLNETAEETNSRLENDRQRRASRRLVESPEEHAARLSQDREHHTQIRSEESEEERTRRLTQDRMRHAILSQQQQQSERGNRLLQRQVGRTMRRQTASEKFRSVAESVTTNEANIQEDNLGSFNKICKHCRSQNFDDEKTGSTNDEFSRCCQKGKVKLKPLLPYPDYLKSLLKGEQRESKNFLECIRSFNSSFAFASMGACVRPPPGNGPYCFRVCGQIVHRAGALIPLPDGLPKFAQLYIFDPDIAANYRIGLPENKECSAEIMRKIGEIMHRHPLAQSIKMLHEVEKEATDAAAANGIPCTTVSLAIVSDRNADQRRYNAPILNEVAVVFQSRDGEPPLERDIIMHLRPDPNNPHGSLQRINILHPSLETMTYPLLFPGGDEGWSPQLARVKSSSGVRERVSLKEYYSYRFSAREEFSPVLSAGKLTQQFIVDAYCRAESNDVNFIRMNQPALRAEKYKGLLDHINHDADVEEHKVGTAVILPSSFQGSPRNMQQHYQDAMAIVRKFGKPDLFITMTCNPKWHEIIENLKPWERVEHRPDLVARVFYLKLKHLLSDICDENKSLFGNVVAKVHVIEFQKRGLPHAHILIILDNNSKLDSVEKIDKVVCAEIPDKETSPRLFNIVMQHMIHGPCGTSNPTCPCMKDGHCSKTFPKEYQDETLGNINGFPKYRRRRGENVVLGNRILNNSWVVPYNPFLSLKYNCHINVEICSSVISVKYLYKYVYKGHDCANVEVRERNQNDESKTFVDSRYVSAPEGIWRIFRIPMHDQSHTIYRLQVHLPEEQTVCFREGQEVLAAERATSRDTTLTAWFKLNAEDPSASTFKYWEIPVHYVWDQKNSKWKSRQRGGGKVIGRMYTVSIKDPERYYLRLLLQHETGTTSFEHLKSIRRGDSVVVLPTFREAAKEKGYLLDDTVWQDTLTDAAVYAMPQQIRQLFAYICAFASPNSPKELWEANKLAMIEDFCHRIHRNSDLCSNCASYALKDIQETFRVLNRKLADFGLPDVPGELQDLDSSESPDEAAVIANDMVLSLNPEQRFAFDQIVEATKRNDNNIPKCFFLDDPGGSGKTYLYTTLLYYFKSKNCLALPSASTGIAANLLLNGRTYHSLYKLPIPTTETSVSHMGMKTEDAAAIRKAGLLIIDECTMASSSVLDTIDRLLKDVMNKKDVPFGGKVLLLGGDFRQCLTIVPHAMRPAIVQSSLLYSQNWRYFQKLSLVNNMRSSDPEYSDWLLKLGDGELGNSFGLGNDVIEVPSEYLCDDLVHEIFGDNISVEMVESLVGKAILCPKNADVNSINDQVIGLMEGQAKTYLSDDCIETEDDAERLNFTTEFLNSINPSGMPQHKLTLKVGTMVMLLRNLNTKKGLCNGTKLIIKSMRDNVIEAEVISGSGSGQRVLIPRIDLLSSETELPFKMRRRQFPIKPAFAMTINKSQGQTLDKVGIFLSEPVFGHGQLYVAFSRVKRAADVKVKVMETPQQGRLLKNHSNVFTKNVVYREVFNLI